MLNGLDDIPPTAPTTMDFAFEDWSAYTQGSWTKKNVYIVRSEGETDSSSLGPTGSIDKGSGIDKYQISADNTTWVDYDYANANVIVDSLYSILSTGIHTRYFRACDKAGNCGPSISRTAKVDKNPPTAPTTMNFVYSDWSLYTDNTWTKYPVYAASSYTQLGSSGATDNESGIDKYQISMDNDTWIDYNYVPEDPMYGFVTNGTHIRYFRACDKAGNCGPSISRTAKINM